MPATELGLSEPSRSLIILQPLVFYLLHGGSTYFKHLSRSGILTDVPYRDAG